ncbi:Tex family protein [Bacillus badius]|uniref:Transcription accessory protein n=1 Tax=Bacillus badius TaxID=1455 RepID=A0ABR5ATH5_BACBA|nr:Tex family protein [Bacillus badius]KIL72933.1 Transcription accessory protein [Bacillus badius]KIL78051.1 Transcription accessory protein [Bacillus badius]KZR57140.1 RNA-binding transcriptional accessory protein [Bacillus badius]MED4717141.1 Tex family protein [Bacillus badius]
MPVEAMLEKDSLIKKTAQDEQLDVKKVRAVIGLVEEGNTVPFIARYRKEMTGALNEVEIQSLLNRWNYLQNLSARKEEVIRLIGEQNKLTPELQAAILRAEKIQTVEDLYRPFKQKRRTKASIAKEKGLMPLAEWLLAMPASPVTAQAETYISNEKAVSSAEEAIEGALHIIAEQAADEAVIRQWIRDETFKNGLLHSTAKNKEVDEKNIYEMYYAYEEPVAKAVPHRILALNRGEKEEILKVSIQTDAEKIVRYISKRYKVNEQTEAGTYVRQALQDAYKRLIQPSVEREVRNELTEKAEDQAIHIFSENLRKLLLQPPLKGKVVLGVDPAYRTGCKLAVVDETGKVLYIGVIYPHPPKAKRAEAEERVQQLLKEHDVEIIAIGNGTASRETEQFIADVIKKSERQAAYIIVNEAGASVYSASETAREEFPDLQVEERSAVSIARRLQDPLAELVKIDPKSVGVGQYQHDVSQKKLNESLTFVVETAVNQVGVNLNTASSSLLQYVAGLNKTVANNIVKFREENGKFSSRSQVKKVPRLGAKTFEQCIGFLRIIDGQEPLDKTAIHPESYPEVKKLLQSMGYTTKDVGTKELTEALNKITVEQAAEKVGIGALTMQDIKDALQQPGRDLRDELPTPLLKTGVMKLEDLKPGMELQGTVRNVVDFGAFVDIGVKEDGLVHISKMKKGFVKHPLDVAAVGDIVTVWIEQVDEKKGRVSLTMISPGK